MVVATMTTPSTKKSANSPGIVKTPVASPTVIPSTIITDLRPRSNRTRSEDRLGHAVNDLLVRRTNRRQYASQYCAGIFSRSLHKIVWAQPHSPIHGHNLLMLKVQPSRLHLNRLVIPLQ